MLYIKIRRFYFCEIAGTGINEDNYHPVIWDLQTTKANWRDVREYPEISDGYGFVWTDNTDAEHQTLITDPRVIYLNLEDTSGIPVNIDLALSNVKGANLGASKNEMENCLV